MVVKNDLELIFLPPNHSDRLFSNDSANTHNTPLHFLLYLQWPLPCSTSILLFVHSLSVRKPFYVPHSSPLCSTSIHIVLRPSYMCSTRIDQKPFVCTTHNPLGNYLCNLSHSALNGSKSAPQK